MNYEVRNLLYRCINPLLLEEGIYFIVRRFLFSLQYRYLPSRWYYPKNVRGQFRKLPPLPEGGLGGGGGQAHNPSPPPPEKGGGGREGGGEGKGGEFGGRPVL